MKSGNSSDGNPDRPSLHCRRGFTLIELMAVAVVIALLSAISLSVYGYVERKTAMTTTRSQMSAIETALELYKSDWGYYPASTPARISSGGYWESVNNSLLYRALSGTCRGCSKVYLHWPAGQIRKSIGAGTTNSTVIVSTGENVGTGGVYCITDVWGTPFNYYCSPNTPFALVNNTYYYPTNLNHNNGYSQGGQINVNSFDLFSYGPDRLTFVAPNLAYGGWNDGPWINRGFATASSANDDLTNFGK